MEALTSLFGPESDETAQENLPPEVEEGKFEYKLKLISPSLERFEHLVTQLKWRLQEGNGEAVYEIGVADNGMLTGLSPQDLDASLCTLKRMAERLGAITSIVRERFVDHKEHSRKVAEVLVRKVPDDQQFIDFRMAVLGNVDSGKSTLLGVLTHGELDNGQGQARLNLFRHLHEIQSGRTSSISHEILGFNTQGEVINYSESRTAEEICENSSKLITLIDLAGHHKYLKTTIFGLTGHSPHFAMLVISANTGIAGTTKEHLGIALALGVPIFVVINKIDMVHPIMMEKAVRQLERILASPGCNKVPYRVRNEDDAVNAATNFRKVDSITPIFLVSCVTGDNLDLITKFLNVLPPLKTAHEREKLSQELAEYQIDEIYSVPTVGTVVGGMLNNGVFREGDKVLAGPNENGEFEPVIIHSLQRNRLPCRVVQAGQAASVAVMSEVPVIMRKGMVLISPKLNPVSCLYFEAKIYVLYHATSISTGFQTTVYIGNVVQTAVIKEMDKPSVSTNEKAVVKFCFIKQPEYIHIGSRVLFREGKTKGIGEVTQIVPHEMYSEDAPAS